MISCKDRQPLVEAGQVEFMTKKSIFTLAHLSDPHMCSLKDLHAHELMNKRIFGYLSWRLHRNAVHRDDVLTAMMQDLHDLNPDHIAVTGDLTHLGTAGQFQMAQQFLHRLGAPEAVTVIPGNHDAYIKTAWNDTFAKWSAYMNSEGINPPAKAPAAAPIEFPSLRVRGRVAIIGVSTARPSAPFLAVGSAGLSQLQRLEKILEESGRRQLCRIVLIHHPPVSGIVKWRKRLTDAEAFRGIIKRCGAELVLHGHVHRSSFTYLSTPAGSTAVISVPSASALGKNDERRARYHVYHIDQSSQGFDIKVSVRGYSVKEHRFIAEGEKKLTGSGVTSQMKDTKL
jgi:3',5'-cyclic AMP phosphodiesterase CpdA